MEDIKHLYIIGNGFDIHHGRKTSYKDFYTWLSENHRSELDDIEEKIGMLDADWWSNFENNLANIDAYEISQNIAYENVPNLLDDHVDRQWNDAQIYTEQLFEEVFDKIKSLFWQWIKHGIEQTNRNKLIELRKKDSFFLSFNYTETLEDSYGIPQHQVLHIHGNIYDEEFIIGHGEDRLSISQKNAYTPSVQNNSLDDDEDYENGYGEDEGLQIHEQLALDAAIDAVAGQRKPVDEIIQKNLEFFNSLAGVKDIHIYGFSFSKIDMPYLDKIASVVNLNDVLWEVSDHNKENEIKIKQFFHGHNIKEERYSIITLEDKMFNKQLKLF